MKTIRQGSAPLRPAQRGSGTPPGAARQPQMPPRRTWGWFAIVLFINYLLVTTLMPNPDAPVAVPYTLFKEEVVKNNVEAIYTRADTMSGRFTTPVTVPVPPRERESNADKGGSGGTRSWLQRWTTPAEPRTAINFTTT